MRARGNIGGNPGPEETSPGKARWAPHAAQGTTCPRWDGPCKFRPGALSISMLIRIFLPLQCHSCSRKAGAYDQGIRGSTPLSGHRLTDFAVLIVAIGEAPNLNTRVTLEQLPWRIYPPHFGLFFETPQIALPATRPFVVWQVAGYPAGLTELVIVDANGLRSPAPG